MSKDKKRLDFLTKQNITKWVGFSFENQSCVWPVFLGENLRSEIDLAMKEKKIRVKNSKTRSQE